MQIELILLWGLIIALNLSALAHVLVRRTYNRYTNYRAHSGTCADQLARMLLQRNGLYQVTVQPTEKLLDDRYDPHANVLYISNPMAGSVASLAVTAHEVGHAMQHAESFWALEVRQVVQPAGYLGASIALIGMFAGWVFTIPALMIGMGITYLLTVGLMFFTLPVELDANRRALEFLNDEHCLTPEELKGAKRVLRAAVFTYVGAALSPTLHGILMLWSRR